MKCILVILSIISLLGNKNQATGSNGLLQSRDSLFFIREYPIKIDGGASFFTYDSVSLDDRKYILVISKDKQAFIQKPEGFIYFKHSKRTTTKTGYKDFYSHDKYFLTIHITNIKKAGDHSSFRSGTIELKDKTSRLFKIHGKVDEYDQYNYPKNIR